MNTSKKWLIIGAIVVVVAVVVVGILFFGSQTGETATEDAQNAPTAETTQAPAGAAAGSAGASASADIDENEYMLKAALELNNVAKHLTATGDVFKSASGFSDIDQAKLVEELGGIEKSLQTILDMPYPAGDKWVTFRQNITSGLGEIKTASSKFDEGLTKKDPAILQEGSDHFDKAADFLSAALDASK